MSQDQPGAVSTRSVGGRGATALLTGGHREQAEDLLQNALTKTAQRWGHVRRRDQPEAYVGRTMYHEQA